MSKSPSPQLIAPDFNPGYYFLHLAKSDPFKCMAHLFDNFTLQELLGTWRSWSHCALCAEYSAFSEGDDRRHLLRFAEVMGELIEALHYALVKWMKGQKQKVKTFTINEKKIRYRHIDGKDSAYQCIYNFTKLYKEKQVKGFLWAMLECVLTDGENYDITRKNLLFDYEGLLSVGKVPFCMVKKYTELFKIVA